MNLYTLFRNWAERTPKSTAVTAAGLSLTYDQLDRRAAQLANILSDFPASSLVAVMLRRSANSLIALLAIMKAERTYVPIDPDTPPSRLEYLLADANPACILTDAEVQKKLPRTAIPVIVLAAEETFRLSDESLSRLPLNKNGSSQSSTKPNSAYVMYTSGSTGSPKGVVVGQKALLTFLNSIASIVNFTPQDALLSVSRATFDISLLEFLVPIITGGHAVIATEKEIANGELLSGLIKRYRITIIQATPSYLSWFDEHYHDSLNALRILIGGEPLPSDLARTLLYSAHEVWNLYGPTEATIWATAHRVTGEDIAPYAPRIVSIGFPLPNYFTHLFDQSMKPVLSGDVGELYISGPAVAEGYLNREEQTSTSFFDCTENPHRMYKTGDLARQRTNGSLDFLGRSDRQVKIRGMRVELEEIEAQLRQMPGVYDAVVTYRNSEATGDRLTGYVLAREGQKVDSAMMREDLRRSLPEHMIPSVLINLETFPLTPHGKLDIAALPDPDRMGSAVSTSDHESNVKWSELRAIFSDALGVADVRPEDNFLDLGGHSLTAMRIVNRIKKELRADIPISLLFLAGSLEEIFAVAQSLSACS